MRDCQILELQTVVAMWVLGTEPRSSGRKLVLLTLSHLYWAFKNRVSFLLAWSVLEFTKAQDGLELAPILSQHLKCQDHNTVPLKRSCHLTFKWILLCLPQIIVTEQRARQDSNQRILVIYVPPILNFSKDFKFYCFGL